jgi:hypothetical protein
VASGALVGILMLTGSPLRAQELEPGAYAAAPVGVNLFVATNTFSKGDLAFDPSGPISEAQGAINTTVLGYVRTWNLAGRLGQIAYGVPIVVGHLEGRYIGQSVEADRRGFGDPRLRVAVNLFGARALDRASFVIDRPRRLLGASVTISMPLGQYSTERLVNLGNHRWAFKPELGFVQVLGRWTFETYGGVWLFTANDEFYRGSRRTQDPIGSLQFHVHYMIRPRVLVSGNANYYFGGRTTVNGAENFDLQRNSRVGVTLTRPLANGRALRVALSRGAVTTIGADFTSLSVAFQQTWGGR